ncbi:hypothetical protein SKAU_G00124270 [Synaphobranchus kaupii]|uniref:Uncharacterized protein n=1 Tax=Synaphobranchus kaupii TaxID=118154 RepID=A0A9Q1FP51_SYNKA|nr:hypothetical protein SKAU_G00124270 [Synaphobranchus kaupii]
MSALITHSAPPPAFSLSQETGRRCGGAYDSLQKAPVATPGEGVAERRAATGGLISPATPLTRRLRSRDASSRGERTPEEAGKNHSNVGGACDHMVPSRHDRRPNVVEQRDRKSPQKYPQACSFLPGTNAQEAATPQVTCHAPQ